MTLIPNTPQERRIIAEIALESTKGDSLPYEGRYAYGEHEKWNRLKFHFGAAKKNVAMQSGNVTFHERKYVGGITFFLAGKGVDDKHEVNAIRDMCYFGSSGLIVLGSATNEGATTLLVTGSFCKHCKNPMIDITSCTWKTCNECAAKCEHAYERGVVRVPKADIGMGNFCQKCGRGEPRDPGEPEKSVAEHHQAITDEMGHVIL